MAYGGRVSPSRVVPTPGTVYHKLVSGMDDPSGEPASHDGPRGLLLASEPAATCERPVTYSQQILKEFGWIETAVGVVSTFRVRLLADLIIRARRHQFEHRINVDYLPPINRSRSHFDTKSIAATVIRISTIIYAT